MIIVKSKYSDKKERASVELNVKKSCNIEAIAIILEMYNMLLKQNEDLSEKELQKTLKEIYKESKGE